MGAGLHGPPSYYVLYKKARGGGGPGHLYECGVSERRSHGGCCAGLRLLVGARGEEGVQLFVCGLHLFCCSLAPLHMAAVFFRVGDRSVPEACDRCIAVMRCLPHCGPGDREYLLAMRC